jgi:hypothetical protein
MCRANFGYAFINFTTSAAAKELALLLLKNCVWKVHGSKKVIKIDHRQKTQSCG